MFDSDAANLVSRTIPQREYDTFITSIKSHSEYLHTEYVTQKYTLYGIKIIPDPFSEDIPTLIIRALKNHSPLSVIRIGDGEMNILSYLRYQGTPTIDNLSFKKIVAMQQDTFILDPLWMNILQDLLFGSLVTADIIGVIGLWRPRQPSTGDIIDMLMNDFRGTSGHWRAIDFMLKLAKKNYFNDKILTSAHLYFSVLEHLPQILPHAQQVFIISNRLDVAKNLSNQYPQLQFKYLPVGTSSAFQLPDHPYFFDAFLRQLPSELKGCLCLVGAGPWSEIYCSWIKGRGGVAVDIGSGFDLLDGKATRPVHNRINPEVRQKYAL